MTSTSKERPVGYLTEREREALSMRRDKRTFGEIGRAIGVSTNQARVVFLKAEKKDRTAAACPEHNAAMFLGVRAVHCFRNHNIDVLSDPKAHIAVARFSKSDLETIPNLGQNSIRQISEWLSSNGLAFRVKAEKISSRRKGPHCGEDI